MRKSIQENREDNDIEIKITNVKPNDVIRAVEQLAKIDNVYNEGTDTGDIIINF